MPAPLPIPSPYFPYPESIKGLGPVPTAGLHAISAVAAVSALSTFGLLSFLLYRAIFWERYYTSTLTRNQNIVLLSNLLLADLIQAIGFLFSTYWVHLDGIFAPTSACTAQGILLNLGDVASGSFVFLISIHTSISVLRGPTIPLTYLMITVSLCWIFGIFLSTLGLGLFGREYFTAAGIWCWVGPKHENARLWSHYTWIFLFEFGTCVVYVVTFVLLRRRIGASQSNLQKMNPSSNQYKTANATHNRINRVTYYMIMYPIVYFVCTAPLAIGRMHSMKTGKSNPKWFYIFAGCMITSAGWIDSVVYALTRRVFVGDHNGDRTTTGRNHTSSLGKDSRSGVRTFERSATDLELNDISPSSTTKHEWGGKLSAHSRQPSRPVTVTTTNITHTSLKRDPSRKHRVAGIPVSSTESDNESLIQRPGSAGDLVGGRITVTKDFEVSVVERR